MSSWYSVDVPACPTLSVDEVAQALGVSRHTIYRGVDAAKIPSIIIGRRVRIPRAWLASALTDGVRIDLPERPDVKRRREVLEAHAQTHRQNQVRKGART